MKLRALLVFVLLIFFSACTAGESEFVSTDTDEMAPPLREVAEGQTKEQSADISEKIRDAFELAEARGIRQVVVRCPANTLKECYAMGKSIIIEEFPEIELLAQACGTTTPAPRGAVVANIQCIGPAKDKSPCKDCSYASLLPKIY